MIYLKLSLLRLHWVCLNVLVSLPKRFNRLYLYFFRTIWVAFLGLSPNHRRNVPLCIFWTKFSWKTNSGEHCEAHCGMACSLVSGKILSLTDKVQEHTTLKTFHTCPHPSNLLCLISNTLSKQKQLIEYQPNVNVWCCVIAFFICAYWTTKFS